VSGRALRWLLSMAAGGRSRTRGPARLTIVRHHRVFADGERRLYHLGVGETMFARQLEACARADLVPVSVREGLDRLRQGVPGHTVAFSFDDGYADNVTRALPLLQRHGARGTFYLTAGLMETRTAPWWDELSHALEHGRVARAVVRMGGRDVSVERETPAGRRAALAVLLPLLRVPPAEQRARLDLLRAALGPVEAAPCELAEWPLAGRLAEAGMEVGAHTLTHPFLSLLSPEEQRREMQGSADLVRERLAAEVTGVAYPNGDHDARTIEAARAAGFAYAVSTRAGTCTAASPPLSLPRRALPEGACTGPGGRFSERMTLAELSGAFDRLRGRAEAAS
jgi:peptidoglycan/xylan/chitin deacetylase (PgdA/CDA1 family)